MRMWTTSCRPTYANPNDLEAEVIGEARESGGASVFGHVLQRRCLREREVVRRFDENVDRRLAGDSRPAQMARN